MDNVKNKPKRHKSYIMAGAACLPNAVMFACYAIFAVIYFVQSLGSVEIRDHGYLIVYVVAIIFQIGLHFIYFLFFMFSLHFFVLMSHEHKMFNEIHYFLFIMYYHIREILHSEHKE